MAAAYDREPLTAAVRGRASASELISHRRDWTTPSVGADDPVRSRLCLDAIGRYMRPFVGLPLSIDVRGADRALRGLHGDVPWA